MAGSRDPRRGRVSTWSAVTWEAARAGGFVAFGLVTASVSLGLLLGLRVSTPRLPRFLTNEVHGFLAVTALAFAGVHVLAVWLDPFTRFGLGEILVPLASHYRPIWMGLGIVALDLALAVWISTRLRSRIGYGRWRRLHYLAFAVYAAALVHGLATGTDTRTSWGTAVYAASALLVGGLIAVRLARSAGRSARSALAALDLVVVLGLTWALAGPLSAGWGRHRAQAVASAPAAPAAATRARGPADPFRAGFRSVIGGRLRATGPDALGEVTLRIGTILSRRPGGLLEVILHGPPVEGGGVQVTASRVLLGLDPRAALYQGRLTALDGNEMTALVGRRGSLRALRLRITLTDLAPDGVRGLVAAEPQRP
jgi:DMSO/TMAO reductase YedYZ heme-binding membrane subunit